MSLGIHLISALLSTNKECDFQKHLFSFEMPLKNLNVKPSGGYDKDFLPILICKLPRNFNQLAIILYYIMEEKLGDINRMNGN